MSKNFKNDIANVPYKLRIAIIGVTGAPGNSSAIRRSHMFAKGLVDQGHEVHLFIPYAWHLEDQNKDIGKIRVKCFYKSHTNTLSTFQRIRNLILGHITMITTIFFYCLKGHYDWILYYAGWNMESLIIGLITKLFRCQFCIQHCDLIPDSKNNGLLNRLFSIGHKLSWKWSSRLSSVIVVISGSLEKEMRRLAPRAKVVRIPILTDVKLFGSGEGAKFRSRLGLSNNIKMIAYAGSFVPAFGVNDLLEAVTLINSNIIDWHLVIAGPLLDDGINVPVRILQLGLSKRTTFVGLLRINEVIDMIAAADVLVVPKRNEIENEFNMPTKLAEYLAAGRPVVTACIGEIPSYLTHEDHVLLYKPGDINEFAHCISRLLIDVDLAKRVANNGKLLAHKFFDYRTNMKLLSDVLLEQT